MYLNLGEGIGGALESLGDGITRSKDNPIAAMADYLRFSEQA